MADQEETAAEEPQEETRTRPRPQLKTREETAAGAVQATQVSEALAPPPTSVTLGGREFRVGRLTFNDLLFAESVGLDLNEVLTGLRTLRLASIRDFVWFMLRKHDATLALEEVGELMPATIADVGALLAQLLAASGLNQAGGGSGAGNDAGSPTGG